MENIIFDFFFTLSFKLPNWGKGLKTIYFFWATCKAELRSQKEYQKIWVREHWAAEDFFFSVRLNPGFTLLCVDVDVCFTTKKHIPTFRHIHTHYDWRRRASEAIKWIPCLKYGNDCQKVVEHEKSIAQFKLLSLSLPSSPLCLYFLDTRLLSKKKSCHLCAHKMPVKRKNILRTLNELNSLAVLK